MPGNVVLVHGWSAQATSMHPMRDFLVANGYQVTDIILSQYVSLDDDVRVEDVTKRMAVVLDGVAARIHKFDLVVHSTGGLVARDWLTRPRAAGWTSPVKRLVMLAPANFGSRLAGAGKSFVGRVLKGWNNWFEVGQQMLNELELASAYQWSLAERDLVLRPGAAGASPYGPGKIYPFVICGSRGHTDGLDQITNEDGSDGVVRPCAANLNVSACTVDFSKAEDDPDIIPWAARAGAENIPFAILPDRNHSTVIEPGADVGSVDQGLLGRLILEALGCDDDQTYADIKTHWDGVTQDTWALSQDDAKRKAAFDKDCPAASALHQYMQVVVRVRDDQGYPVKDFFLEFFSPEQPGSADDTVVFQRQVLKDAHPNSLDSSRRCLFVDRDALFAQFYQAGRRSLALSLSAAKIGANIRYFDSSTDGAAGHVLVHCQGATQRAGLDGRLFRNQTHLIEIVVPRQPIDKVFAAPPV